MIVPMLKFELCALSSERKKLLNALQKTQLVEPVFPEEDGLEACSKGDDVLQEKLSKVTKAIAFFTEQADTVQQKDKAFRASLSDTILLKYDEFAAAASREEELMALVGRAEAWSAALASIRAARNKAAARKAQLMPYLAVGEAFSAFRDTANTACFFGLIDVASLPALQAYAKEEPLSALTVYEGAKQVPVALFCHRSVAAAAGDTLSALVFTRCSFREALTAAEAIAKEDAEIKRLSSEEEAVAKEAVAELPRLKDLKVYADYLSAEEEKAELFARIFKTQATFTMRGYLPKEEAERVKAVVAGVTDAYLLDFSSPTEEDTPPTLLKNKGPARAAEFVTNMYSVPDYREYDPNAFVFIFFMIFFGIIMADIGYGLLLFLGGLVIAKRRRVNDGVKKLASILSYGGIFTVVFGALFGSCFGFSLYHFLPDPSSGSRTDVLTILLGCLALGLLQITVGYVLSAVNSIRHGHILDAVFDAFSWVLFCVGLFFAVFNFITSYFAIPVGEGVRAFFDVMTLPGVIMLGVGLVVAAVTAGRKEKLLGKFTKAFGAVYGIINLLSDVLSYARLFGLMLSGMIIAQQFNGIGLDLIAAGSIGFVFGPVVMLIGHAFNLAMGVLGAYIHDCRLQYIEFFSKFYTGEGALFTPLGSRVQYVHFSE